MPTRKFCFRWHSLYFQPFVYIDDFIALSISDKLVKGGMLPLEGMFDDTCSYHVHVDIKQKMSKTFVILTPDS